MIYRCWSDSEKTDLRELDCATSDEAAEIFFSRYYDDSDDTELSVDFYVQEGSSDAAIVVYRGTARMQIDLNVQSKRVLPGETHG